MFAGLKVNGGFENCYKFSGDTVVFCCCCNKSLQLSSSYSKNYDLILAWVGSLVCVASKENPVVSRTRFL